jgi:hypothetical protein
MPVFKKQKNEKRHRQSYPEKSLIQSLPDGNLFTFFTQQAKIEDQSEQ